MKNSFVTHVLRAGWDAATTHIIEVHNTPRGKDPCHDKRACQTAGRCLRKCGVWTTEARSGPSLVR